MTRDAPKTHPKTSEHKILVEGAGEGGAREYPAGNNGGVFTRRTVCLPSSTEIIIYKRNGKLILDETDSLIN
jgi:hypothetical protein